MRSNVGPERRPARCGHPARIEANAPVACGRPGAATPSLVAELVADELVLERDAPTRSKVGGLLAEVGNRAP